MKSRVVFSFLILGFLLSCRASKPLATTTEVSQDTTTVEQVKLIDYLPLAALNLEIGRAVNLPDLNLQVTRISEGQALVKQQNQVVTQRETTVQLIATKVKQIDRSKDKSVKDSNVNSKVKDKRQTDSNNKTKKAGNEKVKQNNKQVKRGFDWWLLLLFVPLVFFWRHLKKRFSK